MKQQIGLMSAAAVLKNGHYYVTACDNWGVVTESFPGYLSH
nr:hypothetical protein [Flexithrix dorotheae]